MSIYAIADLHLSLGTDKPMDVFSGWDDYTERIYKNWSRLVTDDDTVVIAGDISWAMKLNDCVADFSFINSLPGKKIIVKGNHDLWWATKKKIEEFLSEHSFGTISILFNNAFEVENKSICGTRGWNYESAGEQDTKILSREVGRLRASLSSAKQNESPPVVFLHYPPVYDTIVCEEIIDLLTEYGVKHCYYGHLHGSMTHRRAVTGDFRGISFHLISCDYTDFYPVPVV